MIVLQKLTIKIADRIIIDRLNFKAASGVITHIFGPNGCGKTTLLRAIAGLMDVDGGNISYQNKGKEVTDPHSNMVFLGTHTYLHENLTVMDNLCYLLLLYGVDNASFCTQTLTQMLREWGLFHYRHNLVKELSFGQKKRLLLVLLSILTSQQLALQGDMRTFILLDEPFIGLDFKAREQLLNLLQNMCNNNAVVLLSSHDNLDTACERLSLV